MKIRVLLKNETLWFILAAIFISCALRWPFNSHEGGIDSFYIHSLANSISEFGEINWEINAFSYFGLFPLSYPSGVPILLSEFSQMTGLPMEATILVFSFATAVISALTAFIMALEIRKMPIFAFVVSIAYSASPFMLFLTNWNSTTRGLFMAIVPLTLWILIKIEKESRRNSIDAIRRKLMIILILNLILMAMIHRLIFMLGLFLLAFFVAKLIVSPWLKRRVDLFFKPKVGRLVKKAIITAIIFGTIAFAITIAYQSGWFGLELYEQGLFQGDSNIYRMLNLIAGIAASVGFPLAFLFPISIFLAIKNKKRGFLEIFLITAFILILPFSGSRTYERLMYPAIIILLIFLPVYMIKKKRIRRYYRKLLVLSLILTIPINMVLVDYWEDWPEIKAVDDGNTISHETYMTAVFIEKYFPKEQFVGNNWIANNRIQAISTNPEIPNALSPFPTNNVLIFGVVTQEDLRVEGASIGEILASKGMLFDSEWSIKPELDWIWGFLNSKNSNDALEFWKDQGYNVTIFIEDHRLNMKMTGWVSQNLIPTVGESRFIVDVNQNRYKTFDSGREYIWMI